MRAAAREENIPNDEEKMGATPMLLVLLLVVSE
jgi:hypothetical protein